MTDIEGFLTIYGHSDNLLNNNIVCLHFQSQRVKHELEQLREESLR